MGVGQGDKARLIQRNFQGLSPCCLKECEFGDLTSEFPKEERSSVGQRPRRLYWTALCMRKESRRRGRVTHRGKVALESDAPDSGRRAEVGWEGGLHYNQRYQDR